MSTLTDQDQMPFGKFKGFRMEDVPASYLGWLWNDGLYEKPESPVHGYIVDNMAALEKEDPDRIWKKAVKRSHQAVGDDTIAFGLDSKDLPLSGFPPGRARVKARADKVIQVFVRHNSGRFGAWYAKVSADGKHLEPGPMIAATIPHADTIQGQEPAHATS